MIIEYLHFVFGVEGPVFVHDKIPARDNNRGGDQTNEVTVMKKSGRANHKEDQIIEDQATPSDHEKSRDLGTNLFIPGPKSPATIHVVTRTARNDEGTSFGQLFANLASWKNTPKQIEN